MADNCTSARRELGVYVLGSIEPAGRAAMDHHLGECPRCREELASLAGLPALLRRVRDAESVLAPGWPDHEDAGLPPGALLSRAATLRRRQRTLAAAAAVAMIAGTAAGVSVLNQRADSQSRAPAWHATVQARMAATGTRASVRYAPQPWGTQIEAQISGVRLGTHCQLWAIGTDGRRVPAGGWVIASDGTGWYPGSVPLPATSMRSFEITSMGRVLIIIPASDRAG